MTQTPVAAVLNLGSSYSRQVLRGVRQYARTKDWMLYPITYQPDLKKIIKQLQPAGIITYAFEDGVCDAMRNIGRPVINVSRADKGLPFPRVNVEEERIGAMAAEHLLECGLRNFGYFGSSRYVADSGRESGFFQALGKHALTVSTHHAEHSHFNPSGKMSASLEEIRKWIRDLPKPAGVFTTNDIWALMLSDVCRLEGVRIPDDIAIIGVDNDELLCELAQPSLSSVAIPAQQVGYQAAALLDSLMAGGEPPNEPTLLPPLGVVARQSSDVVSVDDPDLAAAVRYIREHAWESLSVTDIVDSIAISRRSLERKFRAVLGHSPTEEIQRLRLRRAKSLLEGTDLKMPEVARKSGFSNAKQLSTVFHQTMGITPTAYRRQVDVASREVVASPEHSSLDGRPRKRA